MKYNKLVIGGVLLAMLLAFVFISLQKADVPPSNGGSHSAIDKKVTFYKSPTCNCCSGHVKELQRNGYDVEVIQMPDLSAIKQQHNIPAHLQSCHTAIIGDYFVEGHVPIETIDALLDEQPDIDGIALPGMPQGSPGMPGTKTGPFRIFAVTDGKGTLYKTV